MSRALKPGNPVSRYLHDRWVTRRNPLYVWRELEFIAILARGSLDDPQATTEVPNWVLRYLIDAAETLGGLTNTQPQDRSAGHGGARGDPARALAAVPRALGFSRQGWNAFSALWSDVRGEDALINMEIAGEDRKAQQRALGLNHERSLRRVLSRTKPPP
jgi:hypothetical protein